MKDILLLLPVAGLPLLPPIIGRRPAALSTISPAEALCQFAKPCAASDSNPLPSGLGLCPVGCHQAKNHAKMPNFQVERAATNQIFFAAQSSGNLRLLKIN